MNLPPVYSDILKTTDAGPGVGCSNVEVRFRDLEIARIHDSDRVNRVHRARDDSGQNEAERSNAAIGNFFYLLYRSLIVLLTDISSSIRTILHIHTPNKLSL